MLKTANSRAQLLPMHFLRSRLEDELIAVGKARAGMSVRHMVKELNEHRRVTDDDVAVGKELLSVRAGEAVSAVEFGTDERLRGRRPISLAGKPGTDRAAFELFVLCDTIGPGAC